MQAAAGVCAEKGYYATRIDDIAERAGLSKGAVYHHFASKQEVFIAVAEQMLDEIVVMLRAATEADAPVADSLRRLVDVSIEMAGSQELVNGLFDLYVVGLRDEVFQDRIRDKYTELIDAGAALFSRGVASGELRDVNAADAASVFMMSIDGIFLLNTLVEPSDRSLDALGRRLRAHLDIVLRGLVAREEQS